MPKRIVSDTKGRIVNAAWKLFYEQGYDSTTIEDIIDLSGTSRGSFYHYFECKDAILGSLAYLFDEKYEKISQNFPEAENAFDTLLYLNRELFGMIESSIDLKLLTLLYSTQLTTKGEKQLLDPSRTYYRLLRKIVSTGQDKGELTPSMPANEIVRFYAMCERAMIYDWCLTGGDYSLKEKSEKLLPMMLSCIKS